MTTLYWVPSILDIPPEFHRALAYPKSRNPKDPRQRDQLVSETAGGGGGGIQPRKLWVGEDAD